MAMAKLEWRPFNANDWRAYNGAECFPDGSPPRITEWELPGKVLATAVVGPDRALVEVIDDDGEGVALFSYENPLTVSLLDAPLTVEQLRALPGCFDHNA